jgi:hypothetical protein
MSNAVSSFLIYHIGYMLLPRFIDIEASGLDSRSYPIEIAWSDTDGTIESHLINPYAIDSWTGWDYHAQQIHGISRKLCREQGVHPAFVCDRLNQFLKPGAIIYADGIPHDEWWLDTLFEAASPLGYFQFRLLPSDSLMLPLLAYAEPDATRCLKLFESLKNKSRQNIGQRHRAEADVRYLIALYQACATYNNS